MFTVVKWKFMDITGDTDSYGVLPHVVVCWDKTHGRTCDVWRKLRLDLMNNDGILA